MILEICIDSVEGAQLAWKYKAKRVELCSALSVGGLTPSISLTASCAAIAEVEVHAMLRSREGGFVYTAPEVNDMRLDIGRLAKAGAKGVVFGCLTNSNLIDIEACKQLLKEARGFGMEVTFHRAIDYIDNPEKSIEQLVELGFDRVLTSGQKPMAIEGLEAIQKMVQVADGRIQIMAGSGVNADNALKLSQTGIDALHFTSHLINHDPNSLGMGNRTIPDDSKIAAISGLFS